jgi:hypothetical protein
MVRCFRFSHTGELTFALDGSDVVPVPQFRWLRTEDILAAVGSVTPHAALHLPLVCLRTLLQDTQASLRQQRTSLRRGCDAQS